MWAFLSRNPSIGQLILRVGVGAVFIYAFGWDKLKGGIGKWREIGEAIKVIGIHFWYPFWGFMATMAETLGVALFMIGFAFRPACLLVAFNMTIAAIFSYHGKIESAAPAIILGVLFFSMIFIGPGQYSVDKQ